ncbi:GGDEF domain-containing protein [Clostridium sp. WILCCON 0269]|uniref:GGDEF domain-containing protein n=1 Tax=Candidatus Clostridium eludens TaxID=3381663 RepID=A0ABW8SIQ2_9CLOT
MDSIFRKEEEVLQKAQKILETGLIETKKDEVLYRELLVEFKNLLEQTKRVIKMSDIIGAELSDKCRSLDEVSKVDFLTNLYNRRFFNELLIREWESCARGKCFLSVLMLDIDKFKDYNDTYGHLKGDKCLKLISKCLKKDINGSRDIVARYGGEEFVVLMPETDLGRAKYIAEKIREEIEKLQILHEGFQCYGIVTVSIGVAATIPREKSSPENLMYIADKALYRAKESGRNRVNV